MDKSEGDPTHRCSLVDDEELHVFYRFPQFSRTLIGLCQVVVVMMVSVTLDLGSIPARGKKSVWVDGLFCDSQQ